MSRLERSPAIARALASEPHALPEDFATRVAALAEANGSVMGVGWGGAALVCGSIAMLGVCAAGWRAFAPDVSFGSVWLEIVVPAFVANPWLLLAGAGFAAVQALAYRKRTST